MTGWTLFFIFVGVTFLTCQFFRLIELIEQPAPRSQAAARKDLPAAWNVRLWNTLSKKQWTFWKS